MQGFEQSYKRLMFASERSQPARQCHICGDTFVIQENAELREQQSAAEEKSQKADKRQKAHACKQVYFLSRFCAQNVPELLQALLADTAMLWKISTCKSLHVQKQQQSSSIIYHLVALTAALASQLAWNGLLDFLSSIMMGRMMICCVDGIRIDPLPQASMRLILVS